MSILEYLDKNKEWLFSGVGVAFVGYLVARFWPRFFPRTTPKEVIVQVSDQRLPQTMKPESRNNGTPAQITKITTITLAEIAAALENAPPLQKDDVAKHYKGINVQWETKFFSAEKDDDDNVQLTLDFGPSYTHLVYCTVRLSDYRELGVLPKGAPITVMGRIRKVAHKSATLEDVQLFFHSAMNDNRA
jgi:hypothetical protein